MRTLGGVQYLTLFQVDIKCFPVVRFRCKGNFTFLFVEWKTADVKVAFTVDHSYGHPDIGTIAMDSYPAIVQMLGVL